mmetsp:Transcript_18607/g.40268  ORF Transcript_18607/g.40268 Transcript_18607/m.40268 type:complete len:82 (+) Transcript_18607:278-523(+)
MPKMNIFQAPLFASKVGVGIHDRREISLPCQGPKIIFYRTSNEWTKTPFIEDDESRFAREMVDRSVCNLQMVLVHMPDALI